MQNVVHSVPSQMINSYTGTPVVCYYKNLGKNSTVIANHQTHDAYHTSSVYHIPSMDHVQSRNSWIMVCFTYGFVNVQVKCVTARGVDCYRKYYKHNSPTITRAELSKLTGPFNTIFSIVWMPVLPTPFKCPPQCMKRDSITTGRQIDRAHWTSSVSILLHRTITKCIKLIPITGLHQKLYFTQ